MPRRLSYWRAWVTAVVHRHRQSIDAYQIWNEANLRTFWQGTPEQMARLTLIAYRIVKRLDPSARVVAASSTIRLRSATDRFLPAYLKQLRKYRWPVDAFAVHTYGPSTATPALRQRYIAYVRRILRSAHAPRRQLWDTEINYGIKGPGPKYPDRDISGTQAATLVAQTYLDSIRLGISRTYWYAWTPPTDLLGITMASNTPAARALQSVFDWAASGTAYCTNGRLRSCLIARAGQVSQIVWVGSGSPAGFIVPAFATSACDVLGACRAVAPGARMVVGRVPMILR